MNAALRGFADAGSDGIIQVSTGGAEFASGTHVKDMVTGAVALAEFAHVVAEKYPVHVALHTDHCPKDKLDSLRAAADRDLPGAGGRRRGAAVPVAHVGRLGDRARGEPADRRPSCSRRPPRRTIVLELEIGVVGGEEDGVANEINEKLYTTPGDALRTAEVLGARREGPLPAGRDVRQRARRLQAGQRQAAPGDPQGDPGRGRRRRSASDKPFDLVFHGGSGSALEEIREARRLRRGEDERRHRHPVRVHPRRSPATCSPTTTAC